MNFNYHESHHAFGFNRLYVSNESSQQIKQSVKGSNKELLGAGVKSYGKVMGLFLSIFGRAIQVQINPQKTIYVNVKSLSNFAIRFVNLKGKKIRSFEQAAKEVDTLYTSHKKLHFYKKEMQQVRAGIGDLLKGRHIYSLHDAMKHLTSLIDPKNSISNRPLN